MQSRIVIAAALALSIVAVPAVALAAAAPAPAEHRYVVGFHDTPAGLRAGGHLHGARVLAVEPALGFATVAAKDAPGFEARARADHGVRYVETDPVMQLLQYTPDDPRYPNQHGLPLIGAPAAWDVTRGAASVSVCVVDTGVRYTHEDVAPLWGGGHDFVNNDADPWDDRGHGTHVSGIASAAIGNGKGVAGAAAVRVLHAKALDASGYGAWSTVATAIRWCADQGAAAISLSLGGTSGSSTLQSAVDYAWSKGAVLAAAAGNQGATNGVLYPARYASAIAVGCVDASKNLCSFSNAGPEIDLVAPGTSIESTYYTADDAYGRLSGTSMSTPFVAGAAALLKSYDPSLSNAAIRDALERSAEDRGAAGWDSQHGHGLLRIDAALARLGATAPAPAPEPAPAPQADLAAAALAWTPTAPVAGDGVTLTARVTNAGGADAGGFAVRFLLDGAVLGEALVGGLAAGAGVDVPMAWTATEGAHAVEAVVDPAGTLAEADESNNVARASLSVEAAPAPEPTPEPEPAPAPARAVDLSASVASATVRSGGEAVYEVVVTNQGGAREEIRLAVDGGSIGWKVSLGHASVVLAPGDSVVVQLIVKAPKSPNARGTSLLATVTGALASDPAVRDAVALETFVR